MRFITEEEELSTLPMALQVGWRLLGSRPRMLVRTARSHVPLTLPQAIRLLVRDYGWDAQRFHDACVTYDQLRKAGRQQR